jgi:hypothetical protein
MRLFLFLALFIVLAPSGRAHACTNPTGQAGYATFNTTHNVPMYCDGTNWVAMSGGAPSCTLGSGPFSLLDTFTAGIGTANAVWGDGEYIYLADSTIGLSALSFDGTSFTPIATNTAGGSYNSVWGTEHTFTPMKTLAMFGLSPSMDQT